MRFLFRVDAGNEVGLGHFFRSLHLAEALVSRGHSIIFIYKRSSFWTLKVQKGFLFPTYEIRTHNEHDIELGTLIKEKIDIFYVDGIIEYQNTYLTKIRSTAKLVFYQNLSSSRNVADTYILPSIHQGKEFFEGFTYSKIFQGLQYLIFNKDILKLDNKSNYDSIQQVGIIAGGSDPNDTLRKILNLIDFEKFSEQNFIFFYGQDYLFKEELFKEQFSNNVKVKEFNHELVNGCNMLISAFGVSTYEFLSLGMPILTYGHSERNANAAEFLSANTHSLINLAFIHSISADLINSKIKELIESKELRATLGLRGQKLIDHKGLDRVIKILEND